jgi:hypothetical protein
MVASAVIPVNKLPLPITYDPERLPFMEILDGNRAFSIVPVMNDASKLPTRVDGNKAFDKVPVISKLALLVGGRPLNKLPLPSTYDPETLPPTEILDGNLAFSNVPVVSKLALLVGGRPVNKEPFPMK